MATQKVLRKEKDLLLFFPIFEGDMKSRGLLIEKKIDVLQSLASNANNRRSHRLLNDQLLMELVPRLSAQEIRGLFGPPPWGEEVPVSPFSVAKAAQWDTIENLDMDKEANIIRNISEKSKCSADNDKLAVLNAWHRIDSRTRDALRRTSLSDLIKGYEKCVQTFIHEEDDSNVLELEVQDPFYRLLLHGICEFYNLKSVTETEKRGLEAVKIMKIRKKKKGYAEFPDLTLSHFLQKSKEGIQFR